MSNTKATDNRAHLFFTDCTANPLADLLPKPWERYLPTYKDAHKKSELEKTPSQTQHSFANILDVIGSPASPSVPRGNPLGRAAGTQFDKRELQPVHFKHSNQQDDSIRLQICMESMKLLQMLCSYYLPN